jgi:hypothetical protein
MENLLVQFFILLSPFSILLAPPLLQPFPHLRFFRIVAGLLEFGTGK